VQEKKFPELKAERAKIEKTTIPTWISAKLILVKSKIGVASIDGSCVLLFFFFGWNKYFHFCVGFVFHEPQCQQV
jgi:hypothetical protein